MFFPFYQYIFIFKNAEQWFLTSNYFLIISKDQWIPMILDKEYRLIYLMIWTLANCTSVAAHLVTKTVTEPLLY